MKLTRSLLDEATGEGIVDARQADALWTFLEARDESTPSFRATHILYYLGGMLAIGAMSVFMTLGWQRFGGWGIAGFAFAYALLAVLVVTRLLARPGLQLPAGIVATFAVALVPLGVYGLQEAFGLWPHDSPYRDYHRLIDARWLTMELATLAAGSLALWRWRAPFLVMPIAFTLWYLSMDLAPAIFGVKDLDWSLRKQVSMACGAAMIAVALVVDLRSRGVRDYAFWIHLFGVMAFWGGLSLMKSTSELGKLVYCLINLGLIGFGAALRRRAYAVFGGLGVAGYVGHLAHDLFKNSFMFPVALTAIGFAVVWIGVVWQRHEARIAERLGMLLPAGLRAAVLARQRRA
ncbi:MAG: DUF2157 domain-containing protein [Burkholderiaceae bacterium]